MDKFKFKEELTITELIKESPKASAYEKTLIQGRFKVGRLETWPTNPENSDRSQEHSACFSIF